MPRKRNPDRSYGQKLLDLFAHLLFSGHWHSLTDLARRLGCSKQTVLRLVDDISSSYGAAIEQETRGNRSYYRIPRSVPSQPAALLQPEELATLQMCRAFTEHLLGEEEMDQLRRAVDKSSQLLPGVDEVFTDHFAAFRPGAIDYTPQQEILRTLIGCMDRQRVAEVSYRRSSDQKARTFRIKPLKVFTWRQAIYIHARYAKMPGRVWRDPGYDPILALQRFHRADATDTPFRRPQNYDFEKALNRHFGLFQGKPLRVTVELKGWAAAYAAERIWSPDQEITRRKNGSVRLRFTTGSLPEVVTWVIGFGELCRVVSPKAVVEAVRKRLGEVEEVYGW